MGHHLVAPPGSPARPDDDSAEPARASQSATPIVRRVFLRGIRQYIRPSFHPSQNHNDELATTWMAARGMALPRLATEAA